MEECVIHSSIHKQFLHGGAKPLPFPPVAGCLLIMRFSIWNKIYILN